MIRTKAKDLRWGDYVFYDGEYRFIEFIRIRATGKKPRVVVRFELHRWYTRFKLDQMVKVQSGS